jgi:membrane protein YqaA with SNARE-associated domain
VIYDYPALFAAAFVSATLFPMGSEGVLLYLIDKDGTVALLVAVASVGNTLGSLLNYGLGRKGFAYIVDRGFVTQRRAEQTHGVFEAYGAYALLFSWMPLIGDPLTFIAGAARYDLRRFILIVCAAKTARYIAVAAAYFYFT